MSHTSMLDALGLRALGDGRQLLLVFGVDVRPEHVLRGVAEELPVAPGRMSAFEFEDLECVGDLCGEQISVLEADLLRSSLQMHKGPARAMEGIGAGKPWILSGLGKDGRLRSARQARLHAGMIRIFIEGRLREISSDEDEDITRRRKLPLLSWARPVSDSLRSAYILEVA